MAVCIIIWLFLHEYYMNSMVVFYESNYTKLYYIQDYVGMNNWEHVIAFGAVCKTWRAASKHHLTKVGIAHMEGG